MNETKNVSRRTRNPIFFRKDGGWKSVSTDCIVCMEACAYKCIFYMDDGTVKEVESRFTGICNRRSSERRGQACLGYPES